MRKLPEVRISENSCNKEIASEDMEREEGLVRNSKDAGWIDKGKQDPGVKASGGRGA